MWNGILCKSCDSCSNIWILASSATYLQDYMCQCKERIAQLQNGSVPVVWVEIQGQRGVLVKEDSTCEYGNDS